MKINKQVFLSSLLILALPAMATNTLGDSGADVGVAVNPEVAEDSNAKAASWTSFLSPSDILEGIQNTHLPSALRMTDAVQAFMEPKQSSPSDFGEMPVKKSEKELQEYVHRLLEAAATYFKSTKFTDITSIMNNIVSATATFRDNIKGALDAHHITLDAFTEELEGIFMRIVNDLKKIPPPDKAPSHAERAEMVDKVLDDATQAIIKLTTRYGIEEEVVTTYLLALKPHVQALTVVIGDINEQYPQILSFLVFSVTTLLIPESWILKPLLRIFGFGPAGPIKGSVAAWMQRYFWGAAVKAGSWFSVLQAAGMGVLPQWARMATKTLVGRVSAKLFHFLNRE